MEIIKNKDGQCLKLAVDGRLDTITAPELEAAINEEIEGITELVFDFSGLEYISSAGLRVLLSAQKNMNKIGSMKVCHCNDDILEIFSITGFEDILTLEK